MYGATTEFPATERYGLTSQLRRASISIVANIAEGCGRRTNADLRQFLQISLGSAKEVDCLLMFARDLGYLTDANYRQLTNDLFAVLGMLGKLIGRTGSKANQPD